MKQVIIKDVAQVELVNVDMPVRQPGEALIKILYGGICGSDLGTYRGTFLYSSFPRIPGHEFSAEVIEVDENEYGIEKGMIVTGNPYYNCGTCYSCQRGYVNCCESNQTLGAQRDGIFREYFTIPVERLYDGKGLDPKTLALIEPFCISYHSVKEAQVKAGDNVLIVGAGTIGILAGIAAKGMGANVCISDLQDMRLEKAHELGINTTINPGKDDFNEKVKEITNGNGFDVCIECVGLPSTFQNCIDAAAYKGRVAVVGIGKRTLDFHYSTIQTKELSVYGSRNALKQDFIELIDKVSSKVYDIDSIISKIYTVDETAEAFADLAANQDKVLKILVDFTK